MKNTKITDAKSIRIILYAQKYVLYRGLLIFNNLQKKIIFFHICFLPFCTHFLIAVPLQRQKQKTPASTPKQAGVINNNNNKTVAASTEAHDANI